MRNLLTKFVNNSVLANMLLVMILVSGITAATYMVREEMPNVSFDIIHISVAFPGADPKEVEEGISIKIEEAIKGMEGIKTYTTTSMENVSSTSIEIQEGYDGNELLDRIRTKVNEITTFPLGSEIPVITLPPHAEPVMALYINGNLTEKALKEWSYKVKDQMLNLEEVSQVTLFGIRDYEINIEVTEQKLQEYGISFQQLAEIVKSSNLNGSGGIIKNDREEIRVRAVGRKYTGEELSSIVVLANRDGDLITLNDLALIQDKFNDQSIQTLVNHKPAIILTVFKTSQEDTIKIAKAVNEFVNQVKSKTPPGAEIGVLFDNSPSIRQQVNILVKNGIMGLILVFVILWLFLNMRLSLWTGLGILVSVMGGLATVWIIGGTINMVSIFGFIMILGIVADDAIVVGESITWHRKQGKGPIKAAIDGYMEVGLPVMAAVMTTVIAFIPLLFIEGIMGKFIRILPIVVISCLFLSLFESFALLPTHLSHLPGPDQNSESRFKLFRWINLIPKYVDRSMESFTQQIYLPLLTIIIKWRYVFLCFSISLLLISLGLIQGNFLKFELLPKRDGFYITSVVEFPEGTSIEITKKAVQKIEDAIIAIGNRTKTISGDPMIKNILSLNGQEPDTEPGEFGDIGSHLGGVQVVLLDSEKRGVPTDELIRQWQKEVGNIYGAKSISFSGTAMGHPGKPIEIGINGQNLEEINLVAVELMNRLNQFRGVFDVQTDYSKGKNEFQFTLKPEARTLGITVYDLVNQLQTGYYGEEVLRIQRGRDEVKIRFRYSESERRNISSLQNVRIRTPKGDEVPLNVVADAKMIAGSSTITRTDGLRRITVSADVDTAIIHANEIIDDLTQGFFPETLIKHPEIQLVLEGDAGESETSFDTMIIGFILAVLAIYMLIATLFRSYLQPIIIMVTIPFGLIGSIWGHYFMGWDLTMISMFGMVGLVGIVVNDAIVLIERINTNLKEGLDFLDAVRLGGVRRFRAVFLTSITTVGGLAPLMFETDSYASVLVPMSITIVFGVIFATVLTLVLIPCVMVILNDFRLISHRLKNGIWKQRNEVEPARLRNLDFEYKDIVPTPGANLL